VLAKDLVKGMAEQALQWKPGVHLGETVTGLKREQENGKPRFVVVTDRDGLSSRTVLIAGGIGAFTPRKLPLKDVDRWYGHGVYDRVLKTREFTGKRVLIVGGGDSAFDWAVNLHGVASRIVMIHRRDGFRAHPATVAQVRELCAAGEMELRTFWELKGIHGDTRVERVTILNNKTKEEDTLAMDAVLPQLGFISSLGAIAEWGLELEKHDIKVSQLMETSIPGIFAAGTSRPIRGSSSSSHRGRRSVRRGEPRGPLHQSQRQGRAGAQLEHGDLRANRRTGRLTAISSFRFPPPPNRSAPACPGTGRRARWPRR